MVRFLFTQCFCLVFGLFCGLSLGWAESLSGSGGALLVKVVPRGAEVLLNDQVIGSAPVLADNLSPKTYRVQARYPGYRPWGKTVMVRPQEKGEVTLILAKHPQDVQAATGSVEAVSQPPR